MSAVVALLTCLLLGTTTPLSANSHLEFSSLEASHAQVEDGASAELLRDSSGALRSTMAECFVAPSSNLPLLKPIHGLRKNVLKFWEGKSTPEIIESLKPGNPESLKALTDGRIVNGHHRLKILQDRGVDINRLPREIRDPMQGLGLPPGID